MLFYIVVCTFMYMLHLLLYLFVNCICVCYGHIMLWVLLFILFMFLYWFVFYLRLFVLCYSVVHVYFWVCVSLIMFVLSHCKLWCVVFFYFTCPLYLAVHVSCYRWYACRRRHSFRDHVRAAVVHGRKTFNVSLENPSMLFSMDTNKIVKPKPKTTFRPRKKNAGRSRRPRPIRTPHPLWTSTWSRPACVYSFSC